MKKSISLILTIITLPIIGGCASANVDKTPCGIAFYHDNATKAMQLCQESAQQGSSNAELYVARMYYNGFGVRDLQQAIRWYQKAANSGNPDAEYFVGFMYGHGTLMETESQRATNWYRKASAQGNFLATSEMAWRYSVGLDDSGLVHNEYGLDDSGFVTNDSANPYAVESNNWYKKAISQAQQRIAQDTRNAKAGDAASQCTLAHFYKYGININNQDVLVEDSDKSQFWTKAAAAQGATCGEFQLGLDILYGWAESENPQRPTSAQIQAGIDWLTKAANKGDLNALDSLGVLYTTNSQLIPNDKSKAMAYFLRAAKQGNPDSQYHLADMYYYGNGTTRDTCEAYRWYSAAANQATKDNYLSIQAISQALSLDMGYMNAHKPCKYLNQ